MELEELMQQRYSCRKFADTPVIEAELAAILEAGRIAPSAVNRQPWRFVVCQSDEELRRVDATTKCRYGAPLAILVCFDATESAKNPEVTPDYGWIDCGLALMQMALEAEKLGLASCIVGAYDPAKAAEAFNVPNDITTYQYLMIGHAAADAHPSKMHDERRPLDEIVAHGTF